MRPAAHPAWCIVLGLLAAAGCQGVPGQPGLSWQQQQQQSQQLAAQVQEYQRRASQLDANNRDLHAQLAQSQQQVRLMQDQIGLLSKQLGDTADRLAQMTQARQDAEQRLSTLQASTNRRGGATITANSSLRQNLALVDIPGIEVRQDGDVIRIELPADRLYLPKTAQMHQGGPPLLDQVASAVARTYPRQIIGIEGHTDNDPVGGTLYRSSHELTIAQATAVLNHFVERSRMSPQRMFVLGHGANHPLVSNGTTQGKARNRRIEVVVYPETSDGT
jgi:flagellar motor protein MotB